MCEGHYSDLQNFFRQQPRRASESVNLIGEILRYLRALEPSMTQAHISIAVQLFNTLTELIQGPCELNQVDWLSARLYVLIIQL